MTAHSEKLVAELLRPAGIDLNGSGPLAIQVNNPQVFDRVLRGGSLAAGEAYMDGDWDCGDLAGMLTKLVTTGFDHTLHRHPGLLLQILWQRLLGHFRNEQGVRRSERVGREHYDLGNQLFEAMLDPWMQYTCAYWQQGADNLEEAQTAKLKLIGDKLKLEPGMRVLDIGCGWGGLAIYLVENYGVQVTGISISHEQIAYARDWVNRLDLSDRIDIQFCDYRKLEAEPFDRVVSIGMFEQVGVANLGTFFQHCYNYLNDTGLLLLHGITVTDSGGDGTDPWLEKYIFRGGQLTQLAHLMPFFNGKPGGFYFQDLHQFGLDYDRTLQAWWQNFKAAWPAIKQTGKYDERFYRMWRYYLHLCMASFRSGRTQLCQFVGSKQPGVEYVSVR